MRAALQKLWPWAKLTTGKPVLVLGARDEATLKRLLPQYFEKGRLELNLDRRMRMPVHAADAA